MDFKPTFFLIILYLSPAVNICYYFFYLAFLYNGSTCPSKSASTGQQSCGNSRTRLSRDLIPDAGNAEIVTTSQVTARRWWVFLFTTKQPGTVFSLFFSQSFLLTECIVIVGVWKYWVVCLSLCMCVSVYLCVCARQYG